MKAIGFDLGDTLIYYQDVPLNWESLYQDAIKSVAEGCRFSADVHHISAAEVILAQYNTRLHPRTEEFSADRIFTEILESWGLPVDYLQAAQEEFFTYFQKKICLYEDTVHVLKYFGTRGISMGVLTDVPYGMPKELVSRDSQLIDDWLDGVLTSVEVGWRKPDPRGYLALAERLGVDAKDMIYVGNEQKDVVGANKAGIFSVLIAREDCGESYGEKLRITCLSDLIPFYEALT